MAQTIDSPRLSSVDFLERAKAGDEQAWAELFERAYPKMRRSIRRRMDGRLRRRCDSVDIANSVMKDFYAKIGNFEFQSEGAILAFLIRASEQKLIDEHRRQHGLKRDVRMERPVDGALAVASDAPTPSHIVEVKEDYQLLLDAQTPAEREIFEMKAEGDSTDEISEKTGVHPRTIQRYLMRLRKTFLD